METISYVLVTSGVSKPPEVFVGIFGAVDAIVHAPERGWNVEFGDTENENHMELMLYVRNINKVSVYFLLSTLHPTEVSDIPPQNCELSILRLCYIRAYHFSTTDHDPSHNLFSCLPRPLHWPRRQQH